MEIQSVCPLVVESDLKHSFSTAPEKHLAWLKSTVHGHTSSGGDEKQTATGISISPTTYCQQMGPK
jgi:hypothetical protein